MPSREVPVCITDKRLVVTYSDGEGAEAGVAVAAWASHLQRPLAAVLRVPVKLRALWRRQRARAEAAGFPDIQEIEAVGPWFALRMWPALFEGVLWLHFIDNNGALYSLVNGSSSTQATDVVIGATWRRIEAARAIPWFDRVDTKANPVDGLSRGRYAGPWDVEFFQMSPADILELGLDG